MKCYFLISPKHLKDTPFEVNKLRKAMLISKITWELGFLGVDALRDALRIDILANRFVSSGTKAS